MAHKKGEGSVKNGRDSHSKRLGIKIFGGQPAVSGNIILKLISVLSKHMLMKHHIVFEKKFYSTNNFFLFKRALFKKKSSRFGSESTYSHL